MLVVVIMKINTERNEKRNRIASEETTSKKSGEYRFGVLGV